MQRLIDGYQKFRQEVYPEKREHYSSLASGQNPEFLLITCSDSRVQPLEFTGTEAGDFFVERCLGNVIPEYGQADTETASIIEYAVMALKVRHILVVGHSQCGAMKGLLDPKSLEGMPMVAAWLENARATLDHVREHHADLTGEALLDATVRANIVIMLDRVRNMPCVERALQAGGIDVHGWLFDIEHGRVLEYDPEAKSFVELHPTGGEPVVDS
ncbi:MAG: carbonic anhydrase [Isosphaeraceae bacterium]